MPPPPHSTSTLDEVHASVLPLGSGPRPGPAFEIDYLRVASAARLSAWQDGADAAILDQASSVRCRLVWEFFCQVVFGLLRSLFGAERPFLVPSPAIRFAERAERCQGTEMLAQLSGLPLSVACVFAAP